MDQEKAPPSPLKQIRTFQGDVAEALSRQNESLYSIQAGERAKRGYTDAPEATPSKSTLPLLAGSLLLIGVAALGGWLAYGEFARKRAVPEPNTPSSQFLSAESEANVDISGLGRDDLITAIGEASAGAKVGELRHLVLRNG